MKNKVIRRVVIVAVVVFAVAMIVWFFWPDRLARAKEMREELMGPNARQMDPDERRARWQEFNRQQRDLSPAERKELWADVRQKQQEQMDRYFAMSPAEKQKYLDDQINRAEEARKKREAARAAQGSANVPPPNPTFASGNPRSQEDRERLRKERLDDSTPEERAQRDQYFKDLQARRAQRGLPPIGGRR